VARMPASGLMLFASSHGGRGTRNSFLWACPRGPSNTSRKHRSISLCAPTWDSLSSAFQPVISESAMATSVGRTRGSRTDWRSSKRQSGKPVPRHVRVVVGSAKARVGLPMKAGAVVDYVGNAGPVASRARISVSRSSTRLDTAARVDELQLGAAHASRERTQGRKHSRQLGTPNLRPTMSRDSHGESATKGGKTKKIDP
jgi:hypothetical protein